MTEQKSEYSAFESTQDRPSTRDLTGLSGVLQLIPGQAIAALSALRRSMFNSHASPASRIAAASTIVNLALRTAAIEDRADQPHIHTGETLIKRVQAARERLARKMRELEEREAGLQKSPESTSFEGERPCLPNEEPKSPPDNPPAPQPPTPQEIELRTQQVIADHACAALSVLRQAMRDYRASPATRNAAARAILDIQVRMSEIKRRKAWRHRKDPSAEYMAQRIAAASARLAKHCKEHPELEFFER